MRTEPPAVLEQIGIKQNLTALKDQQNIPINNAILHPTLQRVSEWVQMRSCDNLKFLN
jgi:hypothetical protein